MKALFSGESVLSVSLEWRQDLPYTLLDKVEDEHP